MKREKVYTANNNIVAMCDELWAFGEVSDGVLAEIKLKKDKNQLVEYYKIAKSNPATFRKISAASVEFEDPELEVFRYIL